ncbi:MAG: HIT domain-containing protein [bacterium]
MNKDIFCKIVAGDIPAHKVYEDDDFIAFLDINPVNLGHTLLVPKKHYEYVFDLPNDLYTKIFIVARKLAPAIQKAANSVQTGVAIEGFGVPHVHIHLIPIDDVNGVDPCKQHSESEEKLVSMAKKIKIILAAG